MLAARKGRKTGPTSQACRCTGEQDGTLVTGQHLRRHLPAHQKARQRTHLPDFLVHPGGCFAEIRITETQGVALVGDDLNVDGVVAAMGRIRDPEGAAVMDNAFSQTRKYARMGAAARGLPLPWNE